MFHWQFHDIPPLAQDLSMFSHVVSLLFLHVVHANAGAGVPASSSHVAFPKRIWSFWHPPPVPRMVQLAMATWRTYAPDYEAAGLNMYIYIYIHIQYT